MAGEQVLDDWLDGGLDHQLEFALESPHPDPRTIETFNIWFVDGRQRIGINVYLYDVRGGTTRERAVLMLPDGRTFITHSEGSYQRGEEPGGASLHYRCVQPFQRWTYQWRAPALAISEAEELRGRIVDGPHADVAVDLDANMLTEPWVIPLSTGPQSLTGGSGLDDGILLGKYEQLLRGVGAIEVGGERWNFDGVGVKTHVRGPRDMTGMGSHAWVTGHFPSDRGFCLKQLRDVAGRPYFSEAFVAHAGRIQRAEILQSPLFARDPEVRQFAMTLGADGREIHIEIENFHSTWIPLGNWGPGGTASNAKPSAFAVGHGLDARAERHMQQSCARFLWDGEEGYGLCELSG